MEFAFTDEQELLRREARTFLADRYPAERVAELADSSEGWDPASWGELADLGWIGVSVSEEAGGAGLGFLEEAVLFEELGRALYPGPYFSTVALALPELPAELQREVVGGGARWSASLDGSLVPDLGLVDRARRPRRQARRGAGHGRDAGDDGLDAAVRSACRGRRRGRDRRRIGDRPDAHARVRRARARGRRDRRSARSSSRSSTRRSASSSASRSASTRPSRTSSPTRYVETELARSLAYWAAWCVAEEDERGAGRGRGGEGVRGRRRGGGLRALDPGARRHRLHLGARAPPLLQARALDPGVRRLLGRAARGGRRLAARLSAPSSSRARRPGSARRARTGWPRGGWRVLAGVRAEGATRRPGRGAPARRHRRRAIARGRPSASGSTGSSNNAGIAMAAPLEFLPLDELRRQLEVNLVGQLP